MAGVDVFETLAVGVAASLVELNHTGRIGDGFHADKARTTPTNPFQFFAKPPLKVASDARRQADRNGKKRQQQHHRCVGTEIRTARLPVCFGPEKCSTPQFGYRNGREISGCGTFMYSNARAH